MGDRLAHTDPSTLSSDPLHTSIRVQYNYLENVPLALLLALVAELNGAASKRTLNFLFAILFVMRVVHAELGLLAPGCRGIGRLVGYWGSLGWVAGVGWMGFRRVWGIWRLE